MDPRFGEREVEADDYPCPGLSVHSGGWPIEGGHFEVWEDAGGDEGAQGLEDAVFGVLREIGWDCGEGGH